MNGDLKQKIGLFGVPLLSVAILALTDLNPANSVVTRMAAVAVLMAGWWITEAIPIPATALLPVALFPLLGIMNGKQVAGAYFNNIIFLFIGGFIMALAMQRWGLHRRIALRTLLLIGGGPRRIVLGFMVATAFLSMWISNTAATMMMMPIAMAVITRMKETTDEHTGSRFAVGLLIGIAYASSIGGMATLIGTPPNLAFTRIFSISFPNAPEIGFAQWILFGLPCSAIFLTIAWGVLTLFFARRPKKTTTTTGHEPFKEELRRMGRTSYEERVVLVLFVLLAVLWMTRQSITVGAVTIPGWSTIFAAPDFIDDGTVAIAVALLMFLIPSRSKSGERLMDWETATRLHWGIVILFGGGFALAAGFVESGLSAWVGGQLAGLPNVSPVVLVASTCTALTFLTELTSNTATTQMVLPLLASLATAIKTNPLLLMIPATLSASCAFMLPVATPPNAIIFGSGEVKMGDMVKAGIVMNLIGVVLITAMVYLLGTTVFGIDPGHLPDWALKG